MTSLNQLSAWALRRGFLRKDYSPVEALEAAASRLEQTRHFNAFITPLLGVALERAREAERLYLRGEAGSQPLLGIPVAVKDNYDMEQVRTTYGSSMFAHHLPRETADCVRRVEAAGALVVGKTNLHEFAWGITGENPHYGPCHNPWDHARIAGGSSSGSAAAVALRVAPLALGSDTAGSIRIPAGLCGIIGMKPSFDRLPRSGLFPLAPTLDHIGLMSRDPDDLAMLFEVVQDAPHTLAAGNLDEGAPLECDDHLNGVRVGVPQSDPSDQLDDDVSLVVRMARDVMVSLGAEIVELDSAVLADSLRIFAPIQQAEAFFVHHSKGLFPARGAEYGDDVRRRLRSSRSVTLADYLAAATARDSLVANLRRVFETVEVLLTPLGAARTPTLAGLSDDAAASVFRRRVLPHTVPQSLAGIPCCAVRGGFDRDGLPVGVQFSAPRGADHRLLRIVNAFHQATRTIQEKWPD